MKLSEVWEDGIWHSIGAGHTCWHTDGLWRVQIYDGVTTFKVWTEPPQEHGRWVKHKFPKHITTLEDKKEYALAIWRLEL